MNMKVAARQPFCYILSMKIKEMYIGETVKKGMALLAAIEKRGYEAYIAGGAVRDLVMKQLGMDRCRGVHDVDIATNMPIKNLKQAFYCDSNNGEAHGTILVHYDGNVFEVTQFRIDGDYSDNRHPDSVSFAKTFREDCSRRDFTINAMGLDKEGNVIDYFDGIGDLVFRRLRAVGNPYQRFNEDSLRIIRGMRFAARFGLMIDEQTKLAMRCRMHFVGNVAMERIHDEMYKCAGYGKKAFATMVGYMQEFDFCNLFQDCGFCLDRQRLMVESLYDGTTAPDIMATFFCMMTEEVMREFRCSKDEIKTARKVRKNLFDIISGKFGDMYDQESLLYSVDLVVSPEFGMTRAIMQGLYPDQCNIPDSTVSQCRFIAENREQVSEYGKKVTAEGIEQGPEFGKRLKEVMALAYEELRDKYIQLDAQFSRKW